MVHRRKMGSLTRKAESSVPLDSKVASKMAPCAFVVIAVTSTGELRQKFDPLGIGKIAGRLTRRVDFWLSPEGSTKIQ